MNSEDIIAVTRVNIFNKVFGGEIRCRMTKETKSGIAHCTRTFKTFRGRASHEWRCKGPYDKIMANFKMIPVPNLVINLDIIDAMKKKK